MNFLCGALFGFLMAIGSLWLLFFLLGRDDKVETAPGGGRALCATRLASSP
jgi:hypothetical protein